MPDLLVYGAYGYTGELVARRAVDSGLSPVLAGRRASELQPLADELDCEHRAFDLEGDVTAAVEDVSVVAHCAGPFVHTYEPMVEACLAAGTHYLDITGELDVFEAIQARDEDATDAGVMCLPGAGFDVVPTDCIANHLHDRLPTATHLTEAFDGLDSISPGTARTVVEGVDQGAVVREDGRLVWIGMGDRTREVDLDDGRGPQLMAAIPWGDVSTAYYSTAIPNIEVYAPTSRGALRAFSAVDALSPLLGARPVKEGLKTLVDLTVEGPTEQERHTRQATVWAEATDGQQTVRSRLRTAEPYEYTARAVVEIAENVLAGEAPPGYQTPATAYGPELAEEVGEHAFEDLE